MPSDQTWFTKPSCEPSLLLDCCLLVPGKHEARGSNLGWLQCRDWPSAGSRGEGGVLGTQKKVSFGEGCPDSDQSQGAQGHRGTPARGSWGLTFPPSLCLLPCAPGAELSKRAHCPVPCSVLPGGQIAERKRESRYGSRRTWPRLPLGPGLLLSSL